MFVKYDLDWLPTDEKQTKIDSWELLLLFFIIIH